MNLAKYSIGIGDRFGRQGEAQLKALQAAKEKGAEVVPVWNKSYREHQIIGSRPADVRLEAERAVRNTGWSGSFHVDADHVNLKTVEEFIEPCDFFTLDVSDAIGTAADSGTLERFVQKYRSLTGPLNLGLAEPLSLSSEFLHHTAEKYLFAVEEAARIYNRIKDRKSGEFIVEISMDETDTPQSPEELLVILAAVQEQCIPVQTIAPKFSGRFNKGVDYAGNVNRFAREFEGDLAVIRYAVMQFGLPENLKLSVHSGSDKFSLYPAVRRAIRRSDSGIHLKTAGTTWLEELTGLAASGRDALDLAKKIYTLAYQRFDELCRPYASVIDIDFSRLPLLEQVVRWSGSEYANALKHNPSHPEYNIHFRQLLHVAYRIAAEMGDGFLRALDHNRSEIAVHVTENIFERHLKPLFLEE